MAKIDTSTIQGFDEMSAEDKLTALLGLEIPGAVDMKQFVSKANFDKTSSELAAAKKQLAAKMTDDERKAQEAQQKQSDLEQKYEALLRDSEIAKQKANFLAKGYSEKLAEEAAVALYDHDNVKLFACMETFISDHDKALKAEVIKGTPKPGAGNAGGATEDDKPRSVKLAEALGKRNAELNKSAADIRARYTGGMTNG